jgi:hypothetical protein
MKCHFCKKGKGEIPICDENGKTLLICEQCDLDLFDARTLAMKLTKEINIQIRHHKESNNIPAVNSLKHIKNVLLK